MMTQQDMAIQKDAENMMAAYQGALDSIYASFMAQKHLVAGKLDKDVRRPDDLLSLASRLGLLPDKLRVVKVTGSKGKGTTSRMIANILQNESDAKIALFISPEELEHNDRMRINGVPASICAFVEHFQRLQPHLDVLQKQLPAGRYISPMGTFLLIALSWFKEQQVDYFVLETGRGARYDEVGNLPAKLSVLTSILNEHPGYLGPELSDIAENKLAIGLSSEKLIMTKACKEWNDHLALLPEGKILLADEGDEDPLMPIWFSHNRALALSAAEHCLGHSLTNKHELRQSSAAFGKLSGPRGEVLYFDACIASQSLDKSFIQQRQKEAQLVVIASLPDDKDAAGLQEFFTQELACPYGEIALTGTRGYLHYENAKISGLCLAHMHYEDMQALRRVQNELWEKYPEAIFYYLGTQTFIRLVRKTFAA